MNTRHLPLIPVLLAAAMVIEVAGSVWISGACRGVCNVLVHNSGDAAVPQLLGFERNDGGNAGDALSQESGHHGWIADAGLLRAREMGPGPA